MPLPLQNFKYHNEAFVFRHMPHQQNDLQCVCNNAGIGQIVIVGQILTKTLRTCDLNPPNRGTNVGHPHLPQQTFVWVHVTLSAPHGAVGVC